MQLKTTVGLEIGFMPISDDILFRQQKVKARKNFTDSHDTKFDVFQTHPLFKLFQGGPR